MNKFIFIPLLLTSAAPAPYHDDFGPPTGEDDGFHSPWWHPNQNQFPGVGPTGHLGPEFGPFGPQGFGPGNGVKPNGGVFGPPGGENNIPWHPWGHVTKDRPRITYPIYTTPTTTEGSTSSAVDPCIATCRSTDDLNPVCGTNGVTYTNIGMLECAKACGVAVDVKRKNRCSRSPFIPSPGPPSGPDPDRGSNNSRDNGRSDSNSAAVFAFLVCIRNCPVTTEYNPVCGTDGVTYSNSGRLQCAQDCGVDVHISRLSSCSAPVNPGQGDAISSCIQTCSETGPNSPVCGTDNVTYYNDGTLECARNCGRNVQISRRTACSVTPNLDANTGNGNWNGNGGNGNGGNENWNGNGGNGNGANGNWNGNGGNGNGGNGNWNGNGSGNSNGGNGNGGSGNWNANGGGNGNGGDGNWNGNGGNNNVGNENGAPSMTELIACAQLCPITLESNPVCGTDRVTYSNPGKLLCAQLCGVNVRAQKFGPCQGDWVPTPQPACPTLPTVPLSPEQSCINSCAVSPEFKPVCGTDGVTYINLASLLCKQRCGVDVKLLKQSSCDEVYTNKPTDQTPPTWTNTDRTTETTVVKPTPAPLQTCLNECTSTENKPVCGSNGETYANLANLLCSKRCGINVDLQSNTSCNTSPTIDGSTENNLGFTIPPDVLASIFPEEFPVTQPTKVTPTTTEDESFELDQRFEERNVDTKLLSSRR